MRLSRLITAALVAASFAVAGPALACPGKDHKKTEKKDEDDDDKPSFCPGKDHKKNDKKDEDDDKGE